jgi:hypothetical protein
MSRPLRPDDLAARELTRSFRIAWSEERGWAARVRRAIEDAVGRLARSGDGRTGPALAALGPGRGEATRTLVPYLREGRALVAGDVRLPESVEAGILGSICSRLAAGVPSDPGERAALAGDLTQYALSAYLGPAGARAAALA